MHTGDTIPQVGLDAPLTEALHEMTRKGLGMTAVLDSQGKVAGCSPTVIYAARVDREINLHKTAVGGLMTAL